MSIIQFSHLTENERELLYGSPALVTYLIGSADDSFNIAEEEQAKHIVHFRTSTGDPMLFDFFTEVEPKFLTQLHSLEKEYGNLQPAERTALITAELERLNDILPKIDSIYARTLLRSLKSLALAVAEASGGILGFLDVTYEEKHLAELPMITVEL